MVKIVNLGTDWPWPAANAPGAWFESVEEHYDHARDCLPPIPFRGGFFVSEAAFHDERGVPAYAAWVRIEDAGRERYFVRNVVRDGIEAALSELSTALTLESMEWACCEDCPHDAAQDCPVYRASVLA